MSNELICEKMGHVYTIEINRPDRHNSLSISLLVQLKDMVEMVQNDSDSRVLIITGVGDKAFSAGLDTNEILNETGARPGIVQNHFESALSAIRKCRLPVIAMVNGYAIGAGCDLVINCDLKISSDQARFGMRPAKMGDVYGEQGLWRFIKTIGLTNTKDLFFTSRIIDAKAAKEIGLISQVVPELELTQVTYTIAKELSQNAPLSISAMKKIITALVELEISPDVHMWIEELKAGVFNSKDYSEGWQAFGESREPAFTGK